ncbi:hypothetical protein [Bdellovibrio reynosensis]|uniref:Uncharacterized protein n=1 Tax=Bdellovibrio reynosensis TaxID=2835041 RepID=A0ABY4C5L7_9BACT|nr:hypothetical protein [Bdellovibrio reynosensis]UOF00263.1 hypothetical protein MNR06_11180 [Bdellovibrio reynosensis]
MNLIKYFFVNLNRGITCAAFIGGTLLPFTANASQASENISLSFKIANYWAYYGEYSTDGRDLQESLSRLSDLTSRIYSVTSEEAYELLKKDVLSQGGPQFLLSTVGTERINLGTRLGLHNEVDAYVQAVNKLNPSFGKSLSNLADEIQFGPNYEIQSALMPQRFDDIKKCFDYCGLFFLGLQNNRVAEDIFKGVLKNPGDYSENEWTQVHNRFPQSRNNTKHSFRQGVDVKLVSASNECVTTCIRDVAVGAAGGFFGGLKLGSAHLAVAGGVLGGSLGALTCSSTMGCNKSREQERLEQETSRINAEKNKLKAENDLKEERMRAQELRKKNELNDKAQQEKEDKESRNRIKEHHERIVEDKIKEASDPGKNKDARSDSSASCETTKTCDNTANALVIPGWEREKEFNEYDRPGSTKPWEIPHTSNDLMDYHGNDIGIPESEEQIDKKAIRIIKTSDNDGYLGGILDRNGRIVTPRDMSSTPMPHILNERSGKLPQPVPGINMHSFGR